MLQSADCSFPRARRSEHVETEEPLCGLQGSGGAGGRVGRARGVGVGHGLRREYDNDPPARESAARGASDIFERGGKKKAEVDEETVRSMRAKIGKLAVANDFLSRKLKPWTVK